MRRTLALALLGLACGGGEGGDAPDAGPACAPGAGGPYWLLEGETVTAQAVCTTGLATGGDAFAFAPLPAGATVDPATGTLSWTPGLDQGATYQLAVTALGETGVVTIGVADRWDDPGNVPVVDASAYREEYGLPVLHLAASGLNPDADVPATITYRGHVYQGEAKLRGAASLGYPKNSFTVKFSRDDKFNEPAYAFTEKRSLALTTTFDDNSYVRTRMCFELWNRLDPAHLQVRSYSAVVFLNGEYFGLYQVTDHVDGFLMEDHGYWQDGNLYKAVNHDANFRLDSVQSGGPKATLHDGYEKKQGFPEQGQPGAFDDLDALVSFAATSSDAEFAATLDDWIVRRDYQDWWIFVSLVEADDSAGKNSYHYHNPSGGPWRYLPWDFNHSFGQTWQTEREAPDVPPEDYQWANGLFERMLADPAMGPALRARYGEALAPGGAYQLSAVLALYDAMIAEVAPSARRDEGRWAAEYRSYGGWSWRGDFLGFDEEAAYVRDWIAQRWAFVDAIY